LERQEKNRCLARVRLQYVCSVRKQLNQNRNKQYQEKLTYNLQGHWQNRQGCWTNISLVYGQNIMALSSRQTYLAKTFDNMHDKLNNAYEEAFDGEFEQCKNTVNSLIYDLRQLKKSMEP
jgi:hypothetical protein